MTELTMENNFFRLMVLAGLGLYEKVRESLDDLVKRGELSRSEAAVLLKELAEKESNAVKELDRKLEDALNRLLEGFPPTAITRELERIEAKVDKLAARLAGLERAQDHPKKRR